jgi:predicted nucleic acid-binding protein
VILPDTSVWVDHFRNRIADLESLLQAQEIAIHAFVVGELALGTLPSRQRVLADLQDLPFAITAQDYEVLQLIHARSLFGLGLGYIDAHLLTSVLLTPETKLWTRDKRLRAAAKQLGLDAGLA